MLSTTKSQNSRWSLLFRRPRMSGRRMSGTSRRFSKHVLNCNYPGKLRKKQQEPEHPDLAWNSQTSFSQTSATTRFVSQNVFVVKMLNTKILCKHWKLKWTPNWFQHCLGPKCKSELGSTWAVGVMPQMFWGFSVSHSVGVGVLDRHQHVCFANSRRNMFETQLLILQIYSCVVFSFEVVGCSTSTKERVQGSNPTTASDCS